MNTALPILIRAPGHDGRSASRGWPEQHRIQALREQIDSFQEIGFSDEMIIASARIFVQSNHIADELRVLAGCASDPSDYT